MLVPAAYFSTASLSVNRPCMYERTRIQFQAHRTSVVTDKWITLHEKKILCAFYEL